MGRRVIVAVVGAVVALGAVYLVQAAQAPEKAPPRAGGAGAPVLIATAATRTVPVELDAIGTVQARSTVAIKSRVDGQLIEAAVAEGQPVKKGDILFRLDARPFEAQLRQAEAGVARDQANLAKAEADLARYQSLSEKGYSSQQKYEEAMAVKNALNATIRAGEAMIEIARLNLEYSTIRAPVDGRTGSLLAHSGNLVEANDEPMLIITETRPIHVAFSVPEKYLTGIKRRLAAGRVAVAITIPDSPTVTAELYFINNAVDTSTGTIQLKAIYDNLEEALTPGQFVQVRIELDALKDAVVVPTQSVQNGQKGQFVFVMRPDQTVELRAVEIGPSQAGVTVVREGLQPGEVVVTEGQLRLFPGAKVAPKQADRRDKPPAPGPAQS